MVIGIFDTQTIRSIQDKFMDHFPFLKIEFFEAPSGKSQEAVRQIPNNRAIGTFRQSQQSGILEIQPDQKITDLVNQFDKMFGLYIQVYQLDNGGWNCLAGKNCLTLAAHNEMGRLANMHMDLAV